MTPSKTTYACPCCGYKTLPLPAGDSYEICPVCKWEDDPVQFKDPDYKGGANAPSLREAQKNFQSMEASDSASRGKTRGARPDEARDPNWQFL